MVSAAPAIDGNAFTSPRKAGSGGLSPRSQSVACAAGRQVAVGLGELEACSDLRRGHHGALRRRLVSLCDANLGGGVSFMGYQRGRHPHFTFQEGPEREERRAAL